MLVSNTATPDKNNKYFYLCWDSKPGNSVGVELTKNMKSQKGEGFYNRKNINLDKIG